MNSDTRIRHKYRQIFLLFASGVVPELPNGQWEAARDSGDVMCANFEKRHARTTSPTQFTLQHTCCYVRLESACRWGSIPYLGTNLTLTPMHLTKTRGQRLRAKWICGEGYTACSHHAKRCEWRAKRVVGQNNGPVQYRVLTKALYANSMGQRSGTTTTCANMGWSCALAHISFPNKHTRRVSQVRIHK